MPFGAEFSFLSVYVTDCTETCSLHMTSGLQDPMSVPCQVKLQHGQQKMMGMLPAFVCIV